MLPNLTKVLLKVHLYSMEENHWLLAHERFHIPENIQAQLESLIVLMQLFLDPENLSASFNCVNNQLKKVRHLHFIFKQ